jgi:branched-chain amino acid transport system ATP-binding protein
MSTVLRTRGITKHYEGILAVDDISLAVDDGERVGLIGPNGAGKTTLFNCILGVTDADRGSIELDGIDVSGAPTHARARAGMGRTFQRMELFAGSTVRDHLFVAERVRRGDGRLWKDLLGLGRPRPEEIARCDDVLELLGLAHLAGQPVERLSLGQCRLVEVGRALLTEPKVLLLDEPSSGLDANESAALTQTLRAVQGERGFAVLIVEHDVELVRAFTTRCFVLDFGRMLIEGDTETVLSSDEVRAAYLGDQRPAR